MTDQKEMLLKISQGDKDLFGEFMELYQDKVYSLALKLMKNPHDAADASQEIFIKIYRFAGTFRGDSAVSTWVYSIASNTINTLLKKRPPDLGLTIDTCDGDEFEFQIQDDSFSPEREYEKKEIKQILHRALDGLSNPHREILVLRDINGLSYEEIGATLGISEGTVKSRLWRARDALRECLVKEGTFYPKIGQND